MGWCSMNASGELGGATIIHNTGLMPGAMTAVSSTWSTAEHSQSLLS